MRRMRRPGSNVLLQIVSFHRTSHVLATFFAFGDHGVAGSYFSKVAESYGEDFVTRVHEVFCDLSAKQKDLGLFGSASSLHLIF